MRHHPFTLLELVMVMLLLTVIAGLVLPRLSGFVTGRALDEEARRLWALTRYTREQATCRAVPMQLWIDGETNRYGCAPVPGYGVAEPVFTFDCAEHLKLTASANGTPVARATLTWGPDGTLTEEAPDALVLRDERDPAAAWRLTRQVPLAHFALSREVQP